MASFARRTAGRPSRLAPKNRRRLLVLEGLEERLLLTTQPLSLADPSYFGVSSNAVSGVPSVSADGQLVAFQSDATDLVPGDADGRTDIFVYNRATGALTLVSAGSDGKPAGGVNPVLSPDGRYVAYENTHLYLRDLQTGTTQLVDVNVAGTGPGNRAASSAVFSADGKHIAFTSQASNLVSGVTFTNPFLDTVNLFERDLTAGTTTLVSVSQDGKTDANASITPQFSLSADGRFVTFVSTADNLAGPKYNAVHANEVFVRDLQTGVTTQVSVNKDGTGGGNGPSDLAAGHQSMSADGRYVVFQSVSDNLVAGSGGGLNVYQRDLVTGTTALVSAGSTGAGAPGSANAVISLDGRFVAFTSAADGLVAVDKNGRLDVYVRDNQTGTLSLASVTAAGTNGGNDTSGSTNHPYDFSSGGLAFSADGRHLAFQSSATDLTAGVATHQRNLYERDLAVGTTTLVTPRLTAGDGGDNASYAPTLSADGRVVAFESVADNLIALDGNRLQDVFVRDVAAAGTGLASFHTTIFPPERLIARGTTLDAATPDGRYVVFNASSSDIVPGTSVDLFTTHVFVRDRQTGVTKVVDVTANGRGATENAFGPAITPDGRYVVFLGQSTELVSGLTYYAAFRETMAFERDLQTGVTKIVAVNPAGTHDVNVGGAGELAVSNDGRYVAFTSTDVSAVDGLSNPQGHTAVFLRDMQTNTTVLVSHDLANDGQVNGDSYGIRLSADGRYVLFVSKAPDLVANDTNGVVDVFRWDRTTGQVTLVSVNQAGTGSGNGQSGDSNVFPFDSDAYRPVMTPDGRYVVFGSEASDLVAGDANNAADVFLRDLQTGTTTLVSAAQSGGASGNAASGYGRISADGRTVVFLSNATNLQGLPDTNGAGDVFVRNVPQGTTTLVTVNAAGSAAGNGGPGTHGVGPYGGFSDRPFLSADGRFVAFRSTATDLVSDFADGNGPGGADLFVRDLQKGTTKWISVNDSGTASGLTDNGNGVVVLSTDGGTVLFDSATPDLFPGDVNGATDLFAAAIPGRSTIRGQVFNDANANGTLEPANETGLANWTVFLDANGNGTRDIGEPLAVTDAAGRYAFTGLLPGTYTVGILPQADYTRTLPRPAATYAVSIVTDGTTVSGKDFGESIAFPDLAVSNVRFSPTAAGPGQALAVSWTVTNQGNATTPGAWQDAVYLSTKPTLDAGALLLATVPHAGAVNPGAAYGGSATVALPPAATGAYYLIVQADRRGQVVEGPGHANRGNNTAASAGSLSLAYPTLAVGQAVDGSLTAGGPDRYYRFTAAPGQSVVLSLAGTTTGQLELYVRRGSPPTPYDFDFAGRRPGQVNQTVTIPSAEAGTYFVLVHGTAGAALTATFHLTAAQPGFTVTGIDGATGGAGGRVTIPIHGTNFTPTAQVRLIAAANGGLPYVIAAESVEFRDRSLIYATFNLGGRPVGGYTLQVTDSAVNGSAELPGGFTVTPSQGPHLEARIVAPAGIRINSPHAQLAVEFANTGDVDMPAPVFQLTTTMGKLQVKGQVVFTTGGSLVQFVGNGGNSPAGVLRAGDHGRVEVNLELPTLLVIGGGGGGGGGSTTFGTGNEITVRLTTLATGATPVDWAALAPQLRPAAVPAPVFGVLYSNFTAAVGGTVGQFQALLNADAAYLRQVGVTDPSLSRVLAFEFQRADAALPFHTLAGTTDVADTAAGLDLTFGRQFYQSISGRNYRGVLGRGWASNWDVRATTAADGTVTIHTGPDTRSFTRQADGRYAGLPGDYGAVGVVDGAVQLREKDGRVFRFRADGRLDYLQDANGNRVTAGYNAGGQLVTLTHSSGAGLAITYNGKGLVASVSDGAGRSAAYAYDAAGEQLLSVTTADGTTTYGYVAGDGTPQAHALASVGKPDGTHLTYTYDARGRMTGVFRDGVPDLTFAYPAPGGVTFTDATGVATTVLYNDQGRPAVVRDAAGQTTRLTYDAQANLEQVRLPDGATYSYGYDAHGNLDRLVDALGYETDFTYDPRLNVLTSLRDARQNTTAYQYDANGNLRGISYADGSHEQLDYDAQGDLTQLTNARGQAVAYAYNAAGQVTRKQFADGSHVDYTYDARGNLHTAADAIGTTTYDHDSADRVTQVTYPDGRFLKFTYDPQTGRRTRNEDETGFVVNYAYDDQGRLSDLTDQGGNRVAHYGYDAAGRLTRKDLGNGTFTTQDYDTAGRLQHLVHHAPDGSVNSRFDYSYDARGRVSTEATLDGTWAFTYDADGQLVHAVFTSNDPGKVPDQDLQYGYDPAGNRIQTVVNGVTTTYTANARNEYTQVGPVSYTYDADGNLATRTDGGGTTTFAFDPEGRLTGVSGPATALSYQYDPLGNRVAVTDNGQTTRYAFDPTSGTIIGQYSGAGNLLAHFTYGLGLTSRVDAANAAAYYDVDGLGSVVGLSGAAGSYLNTYAYLPFGQVTIQSGNTPNPFTYVGSFGVTATGAGLLNMGLREYDPVTGQFVSNDPQGLAGGDTNLRRYVGNNPVSWIDPLGLARAANPYNGLSDADLAGMIDELAKQIETNLHNFESSPNEFRASRYFADVLQKKLDLAKTEQALRAGRAAAAPLAALGEGIVGAILGILLEKWSEDVGAEFAQDFPEANKALWESPVGFALLKLLYPEDPNELIGPAGTGRQGWVTPQQTLAYTIDFENDPKKANAPAQDVVVTTKLDADLDWNTFTLGDIRFGATTVSVPAGLQSFQTSVATTNVDGSPLRVDISAALNLQIGVATWTFHSVDPATGQVPDNPFAGFLPVDDATHRGQGSVVYTVRAKATVPALTSLDAKATIVFDTNAPLDTNAVANAVAGSANQGFVAQLYVDLFHRQGDAAGIKQWGGLLDQGVRTRAQVAAAFAGATEYLANEVRAAFQQVLRRNVDSTGLGAWTNFLAKGGTLAQLLVQLYGSAEYYKKQGGGTANGFLTALYRDVLGRTPDAGSATWKKALQSGTPPATVAAAFLASPEGLGRQVKLLVQQLLGRAATAAEVSSYVTQLQHGMTYEQLTNKLLASSEYAQSSGANGNQLYVAKLYQELLGRAPDAGGLASLTAALDSATLSRSQLVRTFLSSPEYRAGEVKTLYATYLQHQPDGPSLGSFTNFLVHGGTVEQVAAQLVASPEYFTKRGGGTNGGFLDVLFQDALHRAVDAATKSTLLQALAHGTTTRGQIAAQLFASAEYQGNVVKGFYTQYLHRTGDPAGIAGLVDRMQHGTRDEDILALFLVSTEYYVRK